MRLPLCSTAEAIHLVLLCPSLHLVLVLLLDGYHLALHCLNLHLLALALVAFRVH
jgi:hypothetical protein